MCRPCMRLFRRSAPKRSPSPTPMASPEQKRAALESHRVLGQNLEALQRTLDTDSGQRGDTKALLSTTIQHWEHLAEYFSATVQSRYYNEVIPPQSTAATRTFAVPELFEMILDYLPVPTVLAVAQTCREYKSRIDNSQHMQVSLCLQAAPTDSPFRARFRTSLAHASGGGFHCKPPILRRSNVEKTADEAGPAIDIGAAFFPYGDEQRMPRIGSTYRRMFVTQPPVKELTARVRCCRDLRETVSRENGVTIGDLHDCTAKMVEKHRWCPHEAHSTRMLQNGQVHVLVDFSGKAILRPDDPIIKKFEKELVGKSDEDQRCNVLRRRNSMYRSTKNVAHANGQPIPTMPEWLEANPRWED